MVELDTLAFAPEAKGSFRLSRSRHVEPILMQRDRFAGTRLRQIEGQLSIDNPVLPLRFTHGEHPQFRLIRRLHKQLVAIGSYGQRKGRRDLILSRQPRNRFSADFDFFWKRSWFNFHTGKRL